MKFTYLDVKQRSPEWLSARRGKVTASRLGDWLAVSKKDGSPLKARLDYERELQFERQFGVNYNNFITPAMADGIELEGYVRQELSKILNEEIQEVGCWHSDKFVASPDGLVPEINSMVEIKVFRDASFSDLLQNGICDDHMLQVQGGLLASGASQAHYAAFNPTTKGLKVVSVGHILGIQDRILESLKSDLTVEPFDEHALYFMQSTPPEPLSREENPWNNS